MATLGFRFTIDGLEDDTLVVREYQGNESISDSIDIKGNPLFGFRYQIELASRLSDITAQQTVDHSGRLDIMRNGEVVKQIHGIIRQFSQGDTGHSHTFYSVTLVPALERLSLRRNSRIFQNQSVPEIIAILLQEMNITDCAFAIKTPLKKREFCVQYRESDLQFMHRIAAEEGLMYSFIHQSDKHILLFTDTNDGWQSLDVTVPYNVLSGGVADTPYISAIVEHTQAEASSTALQDNSFKQPGYSFAQSTLATDTDYQLTNYEHFDMPGRFKDDFSGKIINRVRLEFLRREAHTATGKSNQAKLQAGYLFNLEDHLDSAMNREWLVVSIAHQGAQPQALEEHGGEGETRYDNQFTLIPSDYVWRAKPQPTPQVDGPCIALVVGPEGEEIYCDEHGRVKLHFPWDRYSNGDEQSSCWVRVSQGWAGAQYGMMAIPRIGHEVIVSFLHRDPDQPIVTGRTYHATNQSPYSLPANKTKTVIRTETHQGEGFNELSFEDQSGSELIYVHAQKDAEVLIENDHTSDIKHDQHVTVENNRYTQIQANDHLTVDGEQRMKITANQSVAVGGALQQKVTQKTILDSGSEVHLKAGNKIVLDAGSEVTLKAGGSFVKVDAAGVHVVGSAIGLNSGGSAGSGSGYAGQAASLPNVLTALATPAEMVATEISASQQAMSPQLVSQQIDAIKSPTAVCEVCEEASKSV
jgi:type VI secretion system secreted protein VgrG